MTSSLQQSSQIVFVLLLWTSASAWGPVTLTSCGASGSYGPTLAACQSAYSGQSWYSSSAFTFGAPSGGTVNNWQAITVPYTGAYQITASGASGNGNYYTDICRGASVTTTVQLAAGTVVYALVGQMGGIACDQPNVYQAHCYGGAGGGTFVLLADGTPVVVGGGGGGSGQEGWTPQGVDPGIYGGDPGLNAAANPGCDASLTSTSGSIGVSAAQFQATGRSDWAAVYGSPVPGSNGQGGSGGTMGGGAGLYGNGQAMPSGNAALSPLSGGSGADPSDAAGGGFGGGGGDMSGGGGYSGGASRSGGGGSYCADGLSNCVTAYNAGAGSVTITALPSCGCTISGATGACTINAPAGACYSQPASNNCAVSVSEGVSSISAVCVGGGGGGGWNGGGGGALEWTSTVPVSAGMVLLVSAGGAGQCEGQNGAASSLST